MLRELVKLLLANWTTFCYVLIILYFGKNQGFTGCVLPIFLFVWVLIEERVFYINIIILLGCTCFILDDCIQSIKYNHYNCLLYVIVRKRLSSSRDI